MISIKKALDILSEATKECRDYEELSLEETYNRVLAQDIYSPINSPSYPRSAMDGYAVKFSDLEKGTVKKMIGKSYAGDFKDFDYREDSCIRITTGAYIPKGYDTVIRQEDVDLLEDGFIKINGSHKQGDFCIPIGEDVKEGQLLIERSKILKSFDQAVLASCGLAKVKVIRKMRVAFLSTGSEIMMPGEAFQAGKIYNSTIFALASIVRQSGMEVVALDSCPDDEDLLKQKIRTLSEISDMVITTGGVSVGDKDLLESVMADIGEVLFHGIAMKPGTPVMASKIKDCLVLSCSGNPFAAFCNFEVLFWAIADKFYGTSFKKTKKAVIRQGQMKKTVGLTRIVRCLEEDGNLTIFDRHKNSMIADLNSCNAMLIQEPGRALSAGDEVDCFYMGEI
ncbi:MAG: molybdopterin molybdotransferase MoeA [Finegoldia sp.]|nr:molybdopterin molybdotransferase MoeA [Finegoldia sp.]